MEKNAIDSSADDWGCRIIEVAHGVQNRNQFITLEGLEEWRKNQRDDIELYSSFFRYYTDDPLIGPVLAGLGLDFDDEKNPERARKEAVTVAKYLMDKYDIKEFDISIAFSGGKGFHLFTNRRVFGVEPYYWLPKIFKSMAEELVRTLGLKTLDLKIYDRRRLVRLMNSRHEKTGLYKIPLTLTELEKLSVDEIKALAVRPRPINPRVEHLVSEKANAWFLQHKALVGKQLAEKRAEFVAEELKDLEVLPCVRKRLEIGAREGERNACAWQLASYFQKRGLGLDECLRIMRDWWTRIEQGIYPFTWDECERSIRKTYEVGGYLVGCSSEFIEDLCVGKESCPLFIRKPEEEALTKEERERAERLLTDPKILDHAVKLGRKRLIGEDDTLLINFIIICSGQTKYPISGVLTGFSGSGKNEAIRAIKPLIPDEWVFEFTTSTPEAVKYIPPEFTGTLVIYEIAGMESKTGTLGLRSIGEGQSIETIYPIRDEETGRMRLGRAKTNAKNFLTTESDIGLHPDLYRRVIRHSLNDSDILTRRVMAKKLREAYMPESLAKKLGLKTAEAPYSERDFQNALKLLDWDAEVVVFPPNELLELEKMAVRKEQKVALRSHFEKILNFIRVLALLRQRQRICFKDESDGSRYVIASPEDYSDTLRILEKSLMETISRIESRQEKVLALFENESVLDKNLAADRLKISPNTAARLLKNLAGQGYLREDQGSRPYKYELVEKKPESLCVLKNTNEYSSVWQKNLKIFLNRTSHLSSFRIGVFNFCDFKNSNPLIPGEERREVLSGAEIKADGENRQKSLVFSETHRESNNIKKEEIGVEEKPQPTFLYRRVPPGEKCEFCGFHPVEYEIKLDDGSILRRCPVCFEELRRMFKKVEWVHAEGPSL